jgi:heme A synthase
MNCAREEELLDALGRGYVGEELQSHAASCASCRELQTVAGALLDDRAAAMLTAPVPSAGTMWVRMQLRHKQEAAATARRSLVLGQAVTLLVAIALVLAFLGGEMMFGVRELVSTVRVSTWLMVGVAAWLIILGPIASWVAIRQK